VSEVNVPDLWGNKPEVNESIALQPEVNSWQPTSSSFNISVPQHVGHWVISGNFHVYVKKRPNRLNRFMTRVLLGWEWADA
jgi:hypothetical protein